MRFAKCASKFSRYAGKFRNCEWPILTCLSYANFSKCFFLFLGKDDLEKVALFVRPALETAALMEDTFMPYFAERYL